MGEEKSGNHNTRDKKILTGGTTLSLKEWGDLTNSLKQAKRIGKSLVGGKGTSSGGRKKGPHSAEALSPILYAQKGASAQRIKRFWGEGRKPTNEVPTAKKKLTKDTRGGQ